MALRIRFQYPAGASLGYPVERLADGLLYDFADGALKAAPVTLISALTGDTRTFPGRYGPILASPPAAPLANRHHALPPLRPPLPQSPRSRPASGTSHGRHTPRPTPSARRSIQPFPAA